MAAKKIKYKVHKKGLKRPGVLGDLVNSMDNNAEKVSRGVGAGVKFHELEDQERMFRTLEPEKPRELDRAHSGGVG